MAEQKKPNVMDNLYGLSIGFCTGATCFVAFDKAAVAVTGSRGSGIVVGTVLGLAMARSVFRTSSIGSAQLGTFHTSNDKHPTQSP
jgi:hypothetical protein